MTSPNPSCSAKRRRSLSNDQLRDVISIADANPNLRDLGDIIRIIANTGIRVGELKNLRWASVDLTNSRITVNSPKTGSERCIPIGAQTTEILLARRDREPASDSVFGEAPENLFIRTSRQLRVTGNQIGFSPLYFNDLRHTFFIRLANAGIDLHALCLIGGYSTDRLNMKFLRTPQSLYKWAHPSWRESRSSNMTFDKPNFKYRAS